ncbi:hypothetical protein K7432_001911 [Basidiobolus ranarum]|uniref:Uncharacterized protein n=1 Tax=Basidiobolus ranarum TaxID=34480 RepID=A0ABR2X2J5_9FUNG
MLDPTESPSLNNVNQPVEQPLPFETLLENFRTSSKIQTKLVALLGTDINKIESFNIPPPPKTTLETRVWRGFLERNVEIKNPEYNELVIRKFQINPYIGVLDETEKTLTDRIINDIPSNEDYLLLREFQNQEWAVDTVATGVKLAKDGKYHEAIKQYDHALEIYGKCKEAYIARGAALANTGAYYKAVDEFKKALEIDPEHTNARAYLEATLDKIKVECLTRTESIQEENSQQKRSNDPDQEEAEYGDNSSKKKHKKDKSRKKKKKKSRRHSRRHDSDDSDDCSEYSYRSRSPDGRSRSRSRSVESRSSGHSHRRRSRKGKEHRRADQRSHSQRNRSRSPEVEHSTYSHSEVSQHIVPDKQSEWQHYGPEKIDLELVDSRQSKEDNSSQHNSAYNYHSPDSSSRRRSRHHRERSRSRSRDYRRDRHSRR